MITHLAYFVAAWLFAVGLYGIVTSRHMVHLVICISVVQSSSYVLLLTIGYRMGAAAPILPIFRPALRRWIPWCRRSC